MPGPGINRVRRWRFIAGSRGARRSEQLLLQGSDLRRQLINGLLLRDDTLVQLLQRRLLMGQADLKVNQTRLDGIILHSHLNRNPRQ